jgi:hypothetical protein
MIRKAIAILVLLTLVACASTGKDCVREGGIGGTGECTMDQ